MSRYPPTSITDHHEDRWNRLTISQKKNDIDSDVDVDDIMNSYVSNWKGQGRTSAQDQSLRLLAKRENELQGYHDRIAKQFDEIKSTKHIPNQYYRFPVSNMGSPVGAAMMNSDYFPQAIQAYEEKVRALESEMNNREKDVMKTTEVIKVLIEENNYLRDHIAAKNQDIQKVLDTIGLNDGELVHDLKHRLNLLTEENNLLINQLEQLKALQKDTNKALEKTEGELEKVSHEYAAVRDNLGSALAREGSLANDNQTIEIRHQRANDKIRQLEAALEDARRQIDQLSNKHAIAQDHLEASKRDIKEIDEKRNFEISEIVQQNTKLKNENSHLNKQLETKVKALDTAEKEMKKAQRDLESYKLENEEFVQRMHVYKNGISHQVHDKEEAVRKEKAMQVVNHKLEDEIKKLHRTIKQIENDHHEAQEEIEKKHKKDLRRQQKKANKTIAQLEETVHEKDDKINNLNHQIEMLKKQLENHAERHVVSDRSYVAPREVEIREHTQRDYLSPNKNEIKTSSVEESDRLKALTQEISRDIDTAYKKIREQSPGVTSNTNASTLHDYSHSRPGLLNPFTSSYSTDNFFGSGNKRSSSQERNGSIRKNDFLYQSPENARKNESFPHREVQKIVGDILNKGDNERGRSQERHDDILKSSFRPSTRYGNYDTGIYAHPKTTTGAGRLVSFDH